MTSRDARSRALFRRNVSLSIATLAFFLTNCTTYQWRAIPVTRLSTSREGVARRNVRIETEGGSVLIGPVTVEFPYLTGRLLEAKGARVEVDLRNVASTERLSSDAGRQRVDQPVPVAIDDLRRSPDGLLGERVQFTMRDSAVVMLSSVTRIEFPWLEGLAQGGTGAVRVDLNHARSVAVQEFDGVMTTVKTLGLVTAIIGGLAVIVALTKDSCPFVYVDRGHGWEFVGEAYAGAAFRSTQREDLLPVPDPGESRSLRVRLRNEARETQYTDRAELLIVDHDPGARVLSTPEQRAVLVGQAAAPLSAHDRRGRDVTALLATSDEKLVETVPDSVALVQDAPFTDEVTAVFQRPAHGTPVLELVGGNTQWLDLVFGRFFAALGDRLPTYMAQGNDSSAGPRIQKWREREGVDLAVEMLVDGAWRQVATVPTVGPAALREIAVPLPVDSDRRSDHITVRLRSGLGFWRFDRLAMSAMDDRAMQVQRIAAASATAAGGRDERDAVAAADGRYNALSEMNESLDMTFALPPLDPSLARSAFLSSNGYYNVHPPVQARWLPATLKTIRDEPGALSRFGRDLARGYARALSAAGSAPKR